MKPETLSKISWVCVFIAAIGIFYISSLTFPAGVAGQSSKSAFVYHFFAFFWLEFFLLFALVKLENDRKSFIFVAIIIAIFYGILDEFHQLYVPGRFCSFPDFLINSTGIFSATFIFVLFLRITQSP